MRAHCKKSDEEELLAFESIKNDVQISTKVRNLLCTTLSCLKDHADKKVKGCGFHHLLLQERAQILASKCCGYGWGDACLDNLEYVLAKYGLRFGMAIEEIRAAFRKWPRNGVIMIQDKLF